MREGRQLGSAGQDRDPPSWERWTSEVLARWSAEDDEESIRAPSRGGSDDPVSDLRSLAEGLRKSEPLLLKKALSRACERVRGDREVIFCVVRLCGEALRHASPSLRGDRGLVLEAVRQSGQALKSASEELRSDRAVVQAAVRQNGYALQYASEALQGDEEVVLEAVKQNGNALTIASKALQLDPHFVLQGLAHGGSDTLLVRGRLQDERETVLRAVAQNGESLQFASPRLRNDFEVVSEAVRQSGEALRYASEALRNNKTVVLTALESTGQALKHASEALRKDREVVVQAVRQDGYALFFDGVEGIDEDLLLLACRNICVQLGSRAWTDKIKDFFRMADQAKLRIEGFMGNSDFQAKPLGQARERWNSLRERLEQTAPSAIAVRGELAPLVSVMLSMRMGEDSRESPDSREKSPAHERQALQEDWLRRSGVSLPSASFNFEASLLSGATLTGSLASRPEPTLNVLAERIVTELANRTQVRDVERVFLNFVGDEEDTQGPIVPRPWDWHRPLREFLTASSSSSLSFC